MEKTPRPLRSGLQVLAALVLCLMLGAPVWAQNNRYTSIGDSITVGYYADPPPGPYPNGFSPQMRNELVATRGYSAANYRNRAVAGATAATVLSGQITNALADAPNLVTLTVGSNDVLGYYGSQGAADENKAAVFKSAFQAQLNSILTQLRQNAPGRFLFLTNVPKLWLLPAVYNLAPGATVAQKQAFAQQQIGAYITAANEAIATEAATASATVIDIFNDGTATDPANISPVDGFHPSRAGHDALARKFIAAAASVPEAPSLIVTRADDVSANDGQTTLREAVLFANSNGNPNATDAITFDASTAASTFSTRQVITLASQLPNITQGVTITGSAAGVTIDGAGRGITEVISGATEISGLNFVTSGSAASVLVAGSATLLVERCAFDSDGRALTAYANSSLTVRNTSVSGGSAAVSVESTASATVQSCTLIGSGSGLSSVGGNGGTFSLSNTIIAGSLDRNLDFGVVLSTDDNNRLVGTLAEAGLDPQRLRDNGGPVLTVALLAGSSAIDKATSTLPTDARGLPRPVDLAQVPNGVGNGHDIGAFEKQDASGFQSGPSFIVTNTGDSDNGCAIGNCSLREAIGAANGDGATSTITFDASTAASAFSTRRTIALASNVAVSSDLTITGSRAGVTIQQTASGSDALQIASGTVFLNDLTFDGVDDGIESFGALTATRCTFRDSSFGLSLPALSQPVTLRLCTFVNNSIYGVLANRSVSLESCTVSGNNTSNNPDGAGVGVGGGTTTVSNSILAGNTGSDTRTASSGTIDADAFSIVTGSAIEAGLENTGPNAPTLKDNGGPTDTVSLLAGSRAVDAGDPAITSGLDQRGLPRVVRGRLDIGAYEVQNERPSAQAFSRSVNEDNTLAFTTQNFTDNITDADGTLASIQITGLPRPLLGALRLNGASVAANQVIALADLGQLTFTPARDFNGDVSFTYIAADQFGFGAGQSAATVTVQVLAVNDAPTISAIAAQSTSEDTPTGPIAFTVDDVDNATASLTISATSSNTGLVASNNIAPGGSGGNRTLVITPTADQSGTATITVSVSDGAKGSSTTFTLQVLAVNDAPIAQSQSLAATTRAVLPITLTATDIDSPQSGLTFTVLTQPQNGTLSAPPGSGASLRYTARPGFSGTDSFTFRASDGVLNSNLATITLRVSDTNRAPVAVADTTSTPFNTPVTVQVLGNDSDADGDTLSISAVDAAGTRGTLSISSDKRSVLFTPESGFSGSTSFGYTISDGVASSSARATVQVLPAPVPPTPGNRAPVAVADSYTTRGPLQVLAANGVLQNDSDPDGQPLTAILESVPAHGELSFNRDGSFTYTPSVVYSGPDSFTYTASDGSARSALVTVNLQVQTPRDVTPPLVLLAGEAVQRVRRLLPARGSAADVYAVRGQGVVFSSGLRSVVLQLQRGDGQYWNGRSYQRAPFDLRTRLVNRSFFALVDTLPASSPDGRYKWTAVATDNAGLVGRAQQSVLVDSAAPAVVISTPVAGSDGVARVQNLAQVAGRVSEESKVEVALRNASGAYFNGRAFTATPFSLTAGQSEGRWILQLAPTLTLAPGRYTLTVRANDAAGNVGTVQRAVEVASAPTP